MLGTRSESVPASETMRYTPEAPLAMLTCGQHCKATVSQRLSTFVKLSRSSSLPPFIFLCQRAITCLEKSRID